MDVPAPVANTGQYPSAQQSIGSLSGMLGVQQQQQNLQTGLYRQQQEQSGATVAAQNAKEKMAGVQLLQDPIKSGLLDDKGQVTPDAQRIIHGAMPTTGDDQYDKLVTAAQHKVMYNTSVNNLTASERAEVLSAAIPPLADVNSKPEDVIKSINAVKAAHAGTPVEDDYNRIIDTMSGAITQAAGKSSGQILPAEQQRWRQIGQQLATGLDPKLSLQQPVTLASGQVAYRPNVFSTQQTLATGFNPSSSQVAGQTSRQTGGAGIDIDRSNAVSASANAAPGAIRLSQEIDSLADQIGSGKFASGLSQAAAAAGIDPVTHARQILNKDLGQLKTVATANAGSDARMANVLSGYPEDTSATQTIHTAMDYIRGSFRQTLARGQNAEAYAKKYPDMAGFQHADNALSQSTDPLMHEYASLKPEQRPSFFQRNFKTPAEAQEFKNKVKGVFHVTGQ